MNLGIETWKCEPVSFVFPEIRALSENLLLKTFPKTLHRRLFFVIDSSLGHGYPVLGLKLRFIAVLINVRNCL